MKKDPLFRTILPQSREGHVTCQDAGKLEYDIKVHVKKGWQCLSFLELRLIFFPAFYTLAVDSTSTVCRSRHFVIFFTNLQGLNLQGLIHMTVPQHALGFGFQFLF